MKIPTIIHVLSIMFVFSCYSCGKKNFTTPYFPNQVGYKWNYAVFDSTTNQTEPLAVTIIDSKSVNGKTSSIWLLKYPDRSDTFYVSETGDTVTFNSLQLQKRIYVTPFSVGQEWKGALPSSKCEVTGMENVSVEAGTFRNVYIIERHMNGLNYSLYEKIFFKPGIGIIKLYTNEYNLGPFTRKTWELKNYTF